MENNYSGYADFYCRGPYASYLVEHRSAGSLPLRLLHVAQPAGAYPDPPLPEMLVYLALRGARRLAYDWGTGRWEVPWRTGELTIVPSGVATDITVDEKHAFLGLAVPREAIAYLLAEAGPDLRDLGRLHGAPFREPFVAELVQRLWNEAVQGNPAGRLFADGAFLVLAAALARAVGTDCNGDAAAGIQAARHGLDPVRLARVLDHIEADLASDLRFVDLAETAGLSPMHFARQFRRAMGRSPHAYVLERRVARAKTLLAQASAPPLARLALDLGFASQAHFTTVFSRLTGTTPKRYRDMLNS